MAAVAVEPVEIPAVVLVAVVLDSRLVAAVIVVLARFPWRARILAHLPGHVPASRSVTQQVRDETVFDGFADSSLGAFLYFLMKHGRDDDVLHSGIFGDLCDLSCIELHLLIHRLATVVTTGSLSPAFRLKLDHVIAGFQLNTKSTCPLFRIERKS